MEMMNISDCITYTVSMFLQDANILEFSWGI